jgi:hypothetical protein
MMVFITRYRELTVNEELELRQVEQDIRADITSTRGDQTVQQPSGTAYLRYIRLITEIYDVLGELPMEYFFSARCNTLAAITRADKKFNIVHES